MRLNIKIGFCISFLVLFLGCAEDFLDVKQDQALRIPNSIEDADALLKAMVYSSSSRELAIAGGDEYHLTDAIYNGLKNAYKKNAYLWADSVYMGDDILDWNIAYNKIMYANLALEVLGELPKQSKELEEIKASALFHRAYNFYMLSQTFIPPFQQKELNAYGLPLRLESDVSVQVARSTVFDTYKQIIADLTQASVLIDPMINNRFLPSKRSCYALLARAYLMMDDFGNALENAQLCLDLDSSLVDFNVLNKTANFPFVADLGLTNKEIIFFDYRATSLFGNSAAVNKSIIDLYDVSDLRKVCYFRTQNGTYLFKGSYVGANSLFCGLANDEVYLIKAECLARLNRISEASETLNVLLKNRYDQDEFVPISIINKSEMLSRVLKERRKELVLRGARWEDLRRLGWIEGYSEIVKKEINESIYTLSPKDLKYTYPIPEKELEFGEIIQNPR